jgi:hypothetical protein
VIATRGGVTTIDHCYTFGGEATEGGALYISGDSNVTVRRSTFVAGFARRGGAIWNSSRGTTTLIHLCLFEFNLSTESETAEDGGGAIFNAGGGLEISRTAFSRCETGGDATVPDTGGGILNASGDLTVRECTFLSGEAAGAGGGVAARGGFVHLERTRFTDNGAGRISDGPDTGGGGVHVSGDAVVTIHRCRFDRNAASTEGGAIRVSDDGHVTVTRGVFTRNRAGVAGGGLWNSATGTISVTGARIRRNRAPTGRDLFNAGGTFTVDGEDVVVGSE